MGIIANNAASIIKGINIDAQHQFPNPNLNPNLNLNLNLNKEVTFLDIVGGIIIPTQHYKIVAVL